MPNFFVSQRFRFLLSSLVLLSLSGCGDQGGIERTDTFVVGTAPKVVIETFNGEVDVHAGQPGVVAAVSTLRNKQLVEFVSTSDANVVILRARRSGTIKFADIQVGVGMSVRVPPDAWVEVVTSNAEVRVTGIKGNVQATTSGAQVTISDGAGRLEVVTQAAPIRVVGFSGEARLLTSQAPITMTVASGSFSATTSSGKIVFEGRLEPGTSSFFNTSAADIEATLQEPDVTLDLATQNGVVNIQPRALAVPSETAEATTITLGTGAAFLAARTSSGDIFVK